MAEADSTLISLTPAAARAAAKNLTVTDTGRPTFNYPPMADIGRAGWIKLGSLIP
jgi:hypothetical protein